MTGELKWRIILGLVLVFFAGLATGVFAGHWHARHFFSRHGPTGGRMREHVTRELHLTPEQTAQVGPIFDRAAAELDSIRAETRQRVAETMRRAHADVMPYLTPEQQERFQQMQTRHRRMLRRHGLPPPPDAP